jgi:multiple sugar transport system ATP-binding protein
MNLRPAALVPGGAKLGDTTVPLSTSVLKAVRKAGLSSITIGLRPESLTLSPDSTGLAVTVVTIEGTYLHGTLAGDRADATYFVARFDGRVAPRAGETIQLQVHADEVHAFHPDSGVRLG